MKLPRRATAPGTARKPAARNSSSLQSENLVGTLSKYLFTPSFCTSLSWMRKESSTAFFAHSLTFHCPTPRRSATRRLPESSWRMVSNTASLTSGVTVAGVMSARFSKAVSMMFCNDMFFPFGCEMGFQCERPSESAVLMLSDGLFHNALLTGRTRRRYRARSSVLRWSAPRR